MKIKDITDKNNNYKEFEVNVLSDFESKNNEKKQSRLHYSSIVSLLQKKEDSPFYKDIDLKNIENIPGSSFYKDGTLFHGPKFQGIEKLLSINEKGLLLECRLNEVSVSEQGKLVSKTFNPFAPTPPEVVYLTVTTSPLLSALPTTPSPNSISGI